MKKKVMITVLALTGMQLAGCMAKEPRMEDVSTVGTRATAPLESVSETHGLATESQTEMSQSESRISEQEAKEIALAKVPGATVNDSREFKLDYDYDRAEYEGKIYFDNKEYEFEIDAHSGEIRQWEVELVYD